MKSVFEEKNFIFFLRFSSTSIIHGVVKED
jgi:hypothetical protein